MNLARSDLLIVAALVTGLAGCGTDPAGAPDPEGGPDGVITSEGQSGLGGAGAGSSSAGAADTGGSAGQGAGNGGPGGGGGGAASGGQGGGSLPSFGCWAWGKPPVEAVVHAGFDWFESGYPGTLDASENDYWAQNGTLPFAYINMAEVPNTDPYLQDLIGSWYTSIELCQNTSWDTTIVDVRDSRWQDWLVTRANYAYSIGNRGIKWDVAGVENLCNGWAAEGGAAAQQEAIDAVAAVLAELKAQHPDFIFIVNQGYGLAQQHPELVDGFEWENMLNYCGPDSNQWDGWCTEEVAAADAIHANGTPILNLEYADLFGCDDVMCAAGDALYNQAVALGWVPYITVTTMNIEGRGLDIVPPW